MQETTLTVGVGTLTLAGVVIGFQSFSAVGNGNTCYACIQEVDGNGNPSGAWEVFLGTYTLIGTTLSRDSLLSSSTGSVVNFAAGTKRVFLCFPADAVTARTSLGLGTLATQSGTFSGTSSGTNTGDQTNITGNAGTVTTNANLTGPITSTGNATSVASQTGTGTTFVMSASPTLTGTNDLVLSAAAAGAGAAAADITLQHGTAGVTGFGS